jgi:hypothetical protein
MRRKVLVLALLLATCFAAPASAQVKFGLKGGVNVTNMKFSNSVFETNNRAGFFIGPTVKFTLPIVGLGVDVSALYDQRSAKVDDLYDEHGKVEKTLKQHQIAIPVNLRYTVGLGDKANVFFFAGPQFGFNIGEKNQSIVQDALEWRLKTSNFSVNLGIGATLLSHLQVTANYNIACTKTGELTELEGVKSAFKGRNNAWQIGLAYFF